MPTITGTVKDANGNFARRIVRAHRRSDGVVVDEKLSDPATGVFALTCPTTEKHYAVVHDSDAWITYLPFNGDNDSTLFYEFGGKSVTVFGNAKISTAQSKFGGSSAYFDGDGDSLVLPSETISGEFTLEGWVYCTAAPSNQLLFSIGDDIGTNGFILYISTTGQVGLFSNNTTAISPSGSSVIGGWHHIALVRNSSMAATIYVDGVSVGSVALSATISGNVRIGAELCNKILTSRFTGYVDDYRLSKGVARYVANFNPPTAPHFTVQAVDPYLYNVVLGCHLNAGETPAFKDVISGKTITANGDATISSAQSKFGGASAYFDGAGDYLSVASSTDFEFGTGDFTVELWVNRPALTTGNLIDIRPVGGGDGAYWALYFPSSTEISLYASGGDRIRTAHGMATATWYHIAVCRSSGVTRLFINGSQVGGNYADTTNYLTAPVVLCASAHTLAEAFLNAYIDDLRVTKGVARYVANFTPPAQAFPETLEYFGQQNAIIYDHLTPV